MSLPSAFDVEKGLQIHLGHLLELNAPSIEEFPPSFNFPNAYWSSEDKTTFFASLARHSRWRPDLISEDLDGGKNAADVCLYINLLEQASAHNPHTDRGLAAHPAAREMSMEWTAIEEELAGRLSGNELNWRRSRSKVKRDDELKTLKISLHEGGSEVQRKDSISWREQFNVRKQETVHSWKRKDFLMSLDSKYLRGMDVMIKIQKDVEVPDRLIFSNSEENQEMKLTYLERPETPFPHRASVLPRILPDSLPSSSTHIQSVGHSQIDPALLALDAPMQAASEVTSTSTRVLTTEENFVNMSPASRRRLQKRLWMRRKRAMQNGLSASEASTEIVKLKRGRKPKPQSEAHDTMPTDSLNMANSALSVTSEAPEDASYPVHGHDEVPTTGQLASVPKRRPYGCAKLQGLGIDAIALRTDGLDIFHLEKVARLSLFRDAHSLSEEHSPDEQYPPEISHTFIRLLRARLVHFITRLVAHVIVHKDEEKRQKRGVKMAFQSDSPEEIKRENVYEALWFLEEAASSKAVFQRCGRALRTVATHRHQIGNADEDSSEGSLLSKQRSDEKGSENNNPKALRFKTDLGLHVPALTESSAAFLWNPSHHTVINGKEIAEALLEDENKAALRKELRADALLDESDRQADDHHESGLWTEVGVEVNLASQNQAIDEENQLPVQAAFLGHMTQEKTARSLNHRKRGGAIKSRAYIDSDEGI